MKSNIAPKLLGMIGPFELLIILAVIAVALAMAGGVVALVLWLSRRNGKSVAPDPEPPTAAATQRLCPQCGKEMAADAPQGLCPNCLMKVAVGSEAGNPAAASVERKPAPPTQEIARYFPQFEILTLLGQGGMGAVYKARQPALDRFVALKILSARAAADAGFAERFNREARALAKLNHPNIVAVYEFGRVGQASRLSQAPAAAASEPAPQGGQAEKSETGATPVLLHYLVMEYVDGLNLRQLQQTGKLPPREALEIIPQICEALQFAHDEGVVHRDIKPENVMLDKKGRVKIADFGLARILGHEPESFRLTGTKDYMGTPHYMAPEQIERPQAVDHRADIYSLGVVFYEMLTGELPLGKFAPPSKKVQVDVRLDEVVLHTLEKEPERRYQHASEVKTDVESIAHTAGSSSARLARNDETREIERVRRQVKGPAIGLVLTGILNWLAIPLVVFVTAGVLAGKGNLSSAPMLWVPLLALILSGVMILAGLKMKRLETYSLAVASSVLAMLVTPGNLIGLPLGIWSLVVLCNREVQQAFGKGLSRSLSPGQLPHSSRSGVAWKVAAVVGLAVLLMFLGVAISVFMYFMARSDNAHEQARRAQAAAEQAQTEMVHIKLRQAEESLASIQDTFKAGLIPQSELQAAEDELALLKAEVDGDEVQVAQARLAAAENRLATLKALFDTGRIPESEYQAARNAVELRQAELRAVQANRGAASSVKLVTNAVFGPVTDRNLSDYIDLDTGQLFAASEFFDADAEPSPEAAQGWYEQNGIDAVVDTNSASVGLAGFDLLAVPVPRHEWDMSPTRLDYYLATAKPGTPNNLDAHDFSQAGFADGKLVVQRHTSDLARSPDHWHEHASS
jgi:serine/threonine protein kinase